MVGNELSDIESVGDEYLSATGGSQASLQQVQIDEENANAGNDPDEQTFRPRTAGIG